MGDKKVETILGFGGLFWGAMKLMVPWEERGFGNLSIK